MRTRVEVRGTQRFELIEQIVHRLAATLLVHRISIELVERDFVAFREDAIDPLHPIHPLAMNEMADDVERAERLLAVVVDDPGLAQTCEHRRKDLGRTLEDFDPVIEFESHDAERTEREAQVTNLKRTSHRTLRQDSLAWPDQ